MNTLSSHVLDTTLGKPASGIALTLTLPNGKTLDGITDDDGRCKQWLGSEQKQVEASFEAGIYTLRFHCKAYLEANHKQCFYPHIEITFELEPNGGHYHVPLLISPFGFSSYRGS